MLTLFFFLLLGVATFIIGGIYAVVRLWWAWEDRRDSWYLEDED